MIERLLRRHRTARLLGAAAAALLCVCAILLSSVVPQLILPAFAVVIPAAVFAVCLLCNRFAWLTSRGMPAAPSVRHYGDRLDVFREIDAEIAAGSDVRTFGGWNAWNPLAAPDLVVFTPGWLVQVNAAGVSAVRLDDVLWVFKRSRVVSSPWWDREFVSHAIRVYFRPDQWELLSLASPEAVDEVIEELLRRRPEVLTGYFDETREMALADARRGAAELDRRRAALRGISADRLAPWRAFQRRELNEATQHLALRDPDPLGLAWRTAAPPPPPRTALCLRRVIAAEWRLMFGWQLFGL